MDCGMEAYCFDYDIVALSDTPKMSMRMQCLYGMFVESVWRYYVEKLSSMQGKKGVIYNLYRV